jgi:outer membrane protein OmpA-like peptidoglycan-associated protein
MVGARGLTILVAAFVMALMISCIAPAYADDCKRVSNILVLFDASGYMKEKDRYQQLLQQMGLFGQAIPLTADGFFNVGLRHWGLKVGLGCENTESILAVGPWDPERFMNAFPKTVSYGVSSLSAGLRAAADEVAALGGKSIILVIGGGGESCKTDPIQIAERIAQNNPDVEIHTFQIGGSQDGRFYMKGIADKARGTFVSAEELNSPAAWHAWMRRYLVVPCAGTVSGSPGSQLIGAITFDPNSFSVRSKDPSADAANLTAMQMFAGALKADPSARGILHGYSDDKVKPDINVKNSKKRADAVAQFLMKTYGIPVAQLAITPHGAAASSMAAPAMGQDRFGRRVEFELRR